MSLPSSMDRIMRYEIYVFVCMYVCIYICIYVCMYVFVKPVKENEMTLLRIILVMRELEEKKRENSK